MFWAGSGYGSEEHDLRNESFRLDTLSILRVAREHFNSASKMITAKPFLINIHMVIELVVLVLKSVVETFLLMAWGQVGLGGVAYCPNTNFLRVAL